ncbi:MAG TPA: SPASM domain-containing protein [Geoalkalibacter subterraneus]|uniref:SPASM domain-containing protein n=1 Tax=Geoalkalibacter subterraneus TaxID=483547 RepID=A0A831PH44_9BACT|nr:SPASM domain-containing protein [Geoalkalibacter subterraneus]
MRIDLLDAPVRVTWRLFGRSGALSTENLLRVADRLLDAGVFFVMLDGAPMRHEGIAQLLPHLQKAGCRVTVVCGLHPDEVLHPICSDAPVDLLIDATSACEQPELSLLEAQVVRARNLEPGILFRPSPQNLLQIQSLLSFCAGLGIRRLKLPNMAIDDSLNPPSDSDLIGPAHLEQLKNAFADDAGCLRQGVVLEIHDLFLWELLHPDADSRREGYVGCQAANSLAHVAATGELMPCSSWPLSLGSLLDEDLLELWQSPLRFEVRRMIEALPGDCRRCRDLGVCFGGCRGLALSRRDRTNRQLRDPMCVGPR